MKLGKDCTGLEAELQTAQEGLVELDIHCHNCGIKFEKDDEIYVHTKEKEHPNPVCHKKCRDGLPKPESKSVGREIKQETNVFRSHLSKDVKAGYSVFGHHVDGVRKKWTADDLSDLEEMWKEGKSIEEIADALTRRLPRGYHRSVGAVRARIKKLGIEEKTGRYFHSSGRVYGNQIGIEHLAMVNGITTARVIDTSMNQVRLILVSHNKVNGTDVLSGSDNRMRRMKDEGKSFGKISGSNMKASLGKRVTKRH